jgi:hypothetical protein
MERGYELYSIVLVVNSSRIWWELIKSASKLREIPSKDLFDLIHSFALIWSKLLFQVKINPSISIELPTFQGYLDFPVDCSTVNVERIFQSQQMNKFSNASDLSKMWEAVTLDIPILVVGSTPQIVSETILSIISFVDQNSSIGLNQSKFHNLFDKAKERTIIPYISFPNPKFLNLPKIPEELLEFLIGWRSKLGRSFL